MRAAFFALVLAGGCAGAPLSEAPAQPRAARPAPSLALEREVRYYVDEQGVVWDDSGRRVQR